MGKFLLFPKVTELQELCIAIKLEILPREIKQHVTTGNRASCVSLLTSKNTGCQNSTAPHSTKIIIE